MKYQGTSNTRLCLFFTIALFVFVGCKKNFDNLSREGLDSSKASSSSAANLTDSIGLGATEEGPAVYPEDTTINNIVTGYTENLSYYPGDTVRLYLSGPPQHNATISLYDMNKIP